MSKNTQNYEFDDKFTITLRENGLHSLSRALEAYDDYDKHQNKMSLKDAILFLHHGIELLMKEILINHSPFLIFEDLRDAAIKQKKADESKTGIFFLDKPPKTVTYEDAIKRVSAFVKPSELTPDLQGNLAELNQYRNHLEHYAIDVDKEKIVKFLAALHKPLIYLFENQIDNFQIIQGAGTSRIWNELESKAKFYNEAEKEVYKVMQLFNGQKIPGYLLNVESEFTLPIFTHIYSNYSPTNRKDRKRVVDIFAEGDDVRWVVEVKGVLSSTLRTIEQILDHSYALHATPWLVVFSELDIHVQNVAKNKNVLLTSINELNKLKSLLRTQ
jgi:hypothetical protein